jgi:hypothetical protein
MCKRAGVIAQKRKPVHPPYWLSSFMERMMCQIRIEVPGLPQSVAVIVTSSTRSSMFVYLQMIRHGWQALTLATSTRSPRLWAWWRLATDLQSISTEKTLRLWHPLQTIGKTPRPIVVSCQVGGQPPLMLGEPYAIAISICWMESGQTPLLLKALCSIEL